MTQRSNCLIMENQAAMLGLSEVLSAIAADRTDLDLSCFSEATVRHAINRGLGPLLFRATNNNSQSTTSGLFPFLYGAYLTSRVLVHEQLDGLQEILGTLGSDARHVTLLKGISICETHYPEPQLRLMGDIDLLVLDDHIRNGVEVQLRFLGYRQQSQYPEEFYRTLHHSMPFFHPQRNIWVEVHKRLFPPSATVAGDNMFSPSQLASQLIPREFREIQCMQLAVEMQLVYTCSHWAEEFNTTRGLVPMIDVLYLLTRSTGIDWDLILSWLPGSAAAAHLFLMTSYLQHLGLIKIPKEVYKKLQACATNLNQNNLSLLWRLIGAFLVEGRSFGRILTDANAGIIWKTLLLPRSPVRNLLSIPQNLALPPGEPRRFSPSFQLSRIASVLGLRH